MQLRQLKPTGVEARLNWRQKERNDYTYYEQPSATICQAVFLSIRSLKAKQL